MTELHNFLPLQKHIPFYSLLHNERVIPAEISTQENDFGIAIKKQVHDSKLAEDRYSLQSRISTRFKMHPVFTIARRAELAIRRNNLGALYPDALLDGLNREHQQLLNNLGQRYSSFHEDLLVLAVIYNNSRAVQLILDEYDVSPDTGLDVAVVTFNASMLHLLLQRGANPDVYLHKALSISMPHLPSVHVLLHHGADTRLKIGSSGDNAVSCAMKTPHYIREHVVELVTKGEYTLTDKELTVSETTQVPDKRYSLNQVHDNGARLLDALSAGSEINNYVNRLIRDSSSESFDYLVSGLELFIQSHAYFIWSKQGHKLIDAVLHENFHVPENIEGYSKLIAVLKGTEFSEEFILTKIYTILQQIGTDEALKVLSREVPVTFSGVYSRLRQGNVGFPDSLDGTWYPYVVIKDDVIEMDSEGRLLDFIPVDDMTLAYQELEAFKLATNALTDTGKNADFLSDGRAKYFLKSLLNEPRFDLGKRYYSTWAIHSTGELMSAEWHHLVHLPTIYGLTWMCWLYNANPEWIDELLDDIEYDFSLISIRRRREAHTDNQMKILCLISNAMDFLCDTELKSRRDGDVYQLEAVEMLSSVGLESVIEDCGNRAFQGMWSGILGGYAERLESGHRVHMDAYTAITGMVGMRVNDFDVTERVEALLNENAVSC